MPRARLALRRHPTRTKNPSPPPTLVSSLFVDFSVDRVKEDRSLNAFFRQSPGVRLSPPSIMLFFPLKMRVARSIGVSTHYLPVNRKRERERERERERYRNNELVSREYTLEDIVDALQSNGIGSKLQSKNRRNILYFIRQKRRNP